MGRSRDRFLLTRLLRSAVKSASLAPYTRGTASSRCKMTHTLCESLNAEDVPRIAPMRNRTRITVGLPEEERTPLAALAQRYDASLPCLTGKAAVEFLARQGADGSQLALDLPLPAWKAKE